MSIIDIINNIIIIDIRIINIRILQIINILYEEFEWV